MPIQAWGESIRHGKAIQTLRALLPQVALNWQEVRYFERYGEVEMHLLEYLCRRDQDAIDVGANVGGYVHFMRHHARRAIAFEPIPEFVELLRRKFPRDVMIEPIALSDRAGEAELYVPMIDGVMISGCSTLSVAAATEYTAHRALKVRMDRLDTVYGGTAGFIKIDVEGHEQAVLDGAIETIDRCRPRLLVEIEEHLSPGGLERAQVYFSRLGYRGHYVHRGRLEPLEKYSLANLQDPANKPDLTAALRERPRFDDYVYNFIFLPPVEPQETLDRIRRRLAAP
jgi:FkbM family methyltransferase